MRRGKYIDNTIINGIEPTQEEQKSMQLDNGPQDESQSPNFNQGNLYHNLYRWSNKAK
jgi:hypothetical protein